MGRDDERVAKLLWGTVLLLVLVGFALSHAVARGHAGAGARAWVLRAAGAPVMALEPTRDAVQSLPWLSVDSVFSDLPGAYPVVAATRPVPVWRGVRLAAEDAR